MTNKKQKNNCAKENAPQTVSVETNYGTLVAHTSDNPDYPGIYICVNAKTEDGEEKKDLALVEVDHDESGNPYLRAVVWGKLDSEDPTNVINFRSQGGSKS